MALGVFTLLAFMSSDALAHRPTVLDGEELVIDKPKVSYTVPGTFETGSEIFTIYLSYDEPFAAPFEMLVERQGQLLFHRPAFAIVGPGLPKPTIEEQRELPRPVPAGAGAFVELNDDEERLVIFESVMRRVYWSSTPIAIPLVAGDYEIWIWCPERTRGDFALAFGVEEDFSDGGFAPVFESWADFAY